MFVEGTSSRRRRWLVQAVLWLILLAMLGLAVLTQRHFEHLRQPELGEREWIGSFRVRRPAGWVVQTGGDELTLTEPDRPGQPGRVLSVLHAAPAVFASPLEYLVREGQLRLQASGASTLPADPLPAAKPFAIGRWPGLLISQTRVVRAGPAQGSTPRKRIVGVALLPSGRMLLVRLEGEGIADFTDEQLLRRVGESLLVAGQSAPRSVQDIELADDIHVHLPLGLSGAAGRDKFRVGQLLVTTLPHHWLALDLAPCILLPGEAPEQLRHMLRVRDPLYRPGAVRQLDARTFTCQREGESLFPAITYVRTNPDGRALLVEFRWQRRHGDVQQELDYIASLWKVLSEGIQFQESSRVAKAVAGGQAAIGALPADAAEVLAAQPLAQQWQWYHESQPGESRSYLEYHIHPYAISAGFFTDWSAPIGSVGRDTVSWRLARDWSTYDFTATRFGSAAPLEQHTRVLNKRYSTTIFGEAHLSGSVSDELPRLYVPGGVLPALVGRLPFEPMVLQTDWLLAPSPNASAAPLTLLLEPSFDLPRYLPDQREAMRCWLVRVSGSSECSRWYVDQRLQSISFPGGLRVQRIDAPQSP